jgi:hypothetical protein
MEYEIWFGELRSGMIISRESQSALEIEGTRHCGPRFIAFFLV